MFNSQKFGLLAAPLTLITSVSINNTCFLHRLFSLSHRFGHDEVKSVREVSRLEYYEMQNNAKKEANKCFKWVMIDANCEKESIKMIDNDPKNAIGEAWKERDSFIEKLLGILSEMKHWNP